MSTNLVIDSVRQLVENLTFPNTVLGVNATPLQTEILLDKTHYLTPFSSIKVNGMYYDVLEVNPDGRIVVRGQVTGLVPGAPLPLAAPAFFHGQFLDTLQEVSERFNSSDFDRRNFLPMVYLIEPVRTIDVPTDPLSRFQFDGKVKLFILNETDWTERPLGHYEKNIRPLASIVEAIKRDYVEHFKVTDRVGIGAYTVHPKFITRSENAPNEDPDTKVFGNYLSGIEIELETPILSKCCGCID